MSAKVTVTTTVVVSSEGGDTLSTTSTTDSGYATTVDLIAAKARSLVDLTGNVAMLGVRATYQK